MEPLGRVAAFQGGWLADEGGVECAVEGCASSNRFQEHVAGVGFGRGHLARYLAGVEPLWRVAALQGGWRADERGVERRVEGRQIRIQRRD